MCSDCMSEWFPLALGRQRHGSLSSSVCVVVSAFVIVLGRLSRSCDAKRVILKQISMLQLLLGITLLREFFSVAAMHKCRPR
jgi:hypothetical protein